MSRRKSIIRVGDRVKIIVPEVVVRVGYPLTKVEMMERQTPEQLQAIRDMMRAFKTVVYPEKESDMFGAVIENSAMIDRLYQKIRYAMAGRMLEQECYGGKQRRIHRYALHAISGKLATVVSKRVVKTGDYQPGHSGYDYWGEYDYEPSYLSNEQTHILYKLHVDGYGSWWSKSQENGTFSIHTTKDDYKDIEIERCNLIKIDPKNPPYEDEHSSYLCLHEQ